MVPLEGCVGVWQGGGHSLGRHTEVENVETEVWGAGLQEGHRHWAGPLRSLAEPQRTMCLQSLHGALPPTSAQAREASGEEPQGRFWAHVPSPAPAERGGGAGGVGL